MRISADQSIAGYPVFVVREFVRRYRFTNFFTKAAEAALALSSEAAAGCGLFAMMMRASSSDSQLRRRTLWHEPSAQLGFHSQGY